MHTQLVGGPHRDAADPSHGVQRDQCAVCGTNRDLIQLPVHRAPQQLCEGCYRDVMHHIGPPSHPGSVNTCTGRGCSNPFGVSAIWPRNSMHHQGQPSIRACPEHLAASIAALAAEHAAATEGDSCPAS